MSSDRRRRAGTVEERFRSWRESWATPRAPAECPACREPAAACACDPLDFALEATTRRAPAVPPSEPLVGMDWALPGGEATAFVFAGETVEPDGSRRPIFSVRHIYERAQETAQGYRANMADALHRAGLYWMRAALDLYTASHARRARAASLRFDAALGRLEEAQRRRLPAKVVARRRRQMERAAYCARSAAAGCL